MAVTPVSLGPSLRAWAQAGVTHILCDGLASDAERASMSRQGVMHTSPASPHSREQEKKTDAGQARDRNGARSQSLDKPGVVSEKTSAPAFSPCTSVPDDRATWPEPWRGLIAKASPAPILWTYFELGTDLAGIERSADRSAFFRNLLSELRLPRGSSAFWPCAMPEEEAGAGRVQLAGNPPLFAAGVAHLSPRAVVVFGERALAAIGLTGQAKYFRQIMVDGKLLLLLPEIEELLLNAGQRASSVSLLRAVFGSLALIQS